MGVLFILSCALLTSALRVQQTADNGPSLAEFQEGEHLESQLFAPPLASPRICLQNIWIGPLNGNMKENYKLYVAYAKKHGYDHHLLKKTIDPKGRSLKMIPTWQKVPLTLALMTKIEKPCDYVMQMDMDAVIMNDEIKIESFIEKAPQASMIITGDSHVVNAGQSLWKNTEFTMNFLKDMWAVGVEPPKLPGMGGDNAAFGIVLGGCGPASAGKWQRAACYKKMNAGWFDPVIQRRTEKAEDQKIFAELGVSDEHRKEIFWLPKTAFNAYTRDYEEGHFVLHMAGLVKHRKDIVMKNAIQKSLNKANLQDVKEEQDAGLKKLHELGQEEAGLDN